MEDRTGIPFSLMYQRKLSAPEISRSPEARCGGPAPMEACERSLIASPPVLPVLSVSPLSFLHLQPGARQGGRGVRQLKIRQIRLTETACRLLCPNASPRRAHPTNDQLGRHSTCKCSNPSDRKAFGL